MGNPLSSHKEIDNSQTEEMILPHLLASFDIFDSYNEIEDTLRINEYDHDKSQIEAERFEPLNSRDDIEILNFYQDSHVTENNNEKNNMRRSSHKKENVNDSEFFSRVLYVQKYLEKERSNEKNVAIGKKQIKLRLKNKKELPKQEEEEKEEEYGRSLLSDLRLGDSEPNSSRSIHLDDEALIGSRNDNINANEYERMLHSSSEIYNKYNATC